MFQTSERAPAPGGFQRVGRWECTLEEAAGVIGLLTSELPEDGEFRLLLAGANAQTAIDYLRTGELDSGTLAAIAKTLVERVDRVANLTETEGMELIGAAANLGAQRRVTDEFEGIVLDPESTEHHLQKKLDGNYWLLGGNYVGKLSRRRFVVLDTYDIPLIRADGVLHIVELKKANVRNLVVPHRQHFAVGDEVNEAVNQAMNYLPSADEQRAQILADLKVECRRAQATVIIGHPAHNDRDDVTPEELREALRTYNSHLSRIEVLTYEDVLVTARNTIAALARQVETESTYVEIEPDEPPLPGPPAAESR